MATPEWIESAARTPKPATGVDREWGDHLLVPARADAERDAIERGKSSRTVVRLAAAWHGSDADACVGGCGHPRHAADMAAAREVLAALGLAEAAEEPLARRCIRCGIVRPLREFPVYGGVRPGRRSYCRRCK